MTDQFIDRANLEALSNDMDPTTSPTGSEITWPNSAIKELVRMAFMAGVDAANAQLIANAETEWGVRDVRSTDPRFVLPHKTRDSAEHLASEMPYAQAVHRRVTAWTTDEEGK